MAWTLPGEIEDALWAAAAERLPAAALEGRALHAAIADRTRRYTSERERLGARAPDEPADLAARALFFTVADAAKIAVPLAELTRRGLLPPRRPLAVLDVGAGAGAMTLGLHAALAPAHAAAVTAIDRDADALAILAAAGRRLGIDVATRALDLRAASPDPGPYDLIVAGTVLNELPAAERLPLVQRLLAALAPDGALILLEPALRETARALHELRDAVIRAGAAHVFAPCTRAGAPCPALADPDDWCHEDRPFNPPPRLARLAHATGLRRHGLKFAYLTLRRAPDPLAVPPPGRRALRVVSDALDQKGTIERIVCGDAGRERLRLLRRERTGATRALAEARRGDVVIVAGRTEGLDLIR